MMVIQNSARQQDISRGVAHNLGAESSPSFHDDVRAAKGID
jgi:hypothetical protein